MTSYLFLNMAAATAKYYFRFCIYWCQYLQKVKVYQHPQFRRHISIDGWYITTSMFEKQTSAILEFYFRFRSQPLRCNLHVILHHATEFRPNRSSRCGNMTSYQFSRWLPRPLNTTSSFVFVDLTAFSRLKSISKPNFVDISQFNSRLRYNYFRFWKRDVRHIGIILPVSISTISS